MVSFKFAIIANLDALYETVTKGSPIWVTFTFAAIGLASIFFYLFNRQYIRIRKEAHSEALKLKEDNIVSQKIRIAELETERNHYRDQSHANNNRCQTLALELTELRSKPNVDALAAVLKEWRQDDKDWREEQTRINNQFLKALESLTLDIKKLHNK